MDPFVAEIRIFPFNFAPKGWAFCDGQLLPLSQNTALFSLLGTYYGGDGKATFALPNLQGSAPMHSSMYGGAPSGLSDRPLGENGGEPFVTLLASEMPAHSHSFECTTANGTTATASGNQLAKGMKGNFQASNNIKMYSSAANPNAQLSPAS